MGVRTYTGIVNPSFLNRTSPHTLSMTSLASDVDQDIRVCSEVCTGLLGPDAVAKEDGVRPTDRRHRICDRPEPRKGVDCQEKFS